MVNMLNRAPLLFQIHVMLQVKKRSFGSFDSVGLVPNSCFVLVLRSEVYDNF